MSEQRGEGRDLAWLRLQIIVALASSDELYKLLVLKGGNALNLLHDIGQRSSLDLDYSLEGDVSNKDAFGATLEDALRQHFSTKGVHVFDWRFTSRPTKPGPGFEPTWGGYNGEFKIIEAPLFKSLGDDIELARKRAWGISPGGGAARTFRIELSKYEY